MPSFLSTILGLVALTATPLLAIPLDPTTHSLNPRSLSGQATYYGGNVAGGACSFSTYTLPSGIYGTALSDSNWATSANCGGCLTATYKGKSVTAMIVDECPGCGTNHLDLFPDAFSALADQSLGVIDIVWDYVTCAITSPLQIHMKSGVSAYWFSAQVVNAKLRTAKLEVSVDSGKTWKATTRQDYNFFEISSGVGATTAWVRITSTSGGTVTVKSVTMTGDAVVTATANYA